MSQYEKILDALYGKPRADGSRMWSFGIIHEIEIKDAAHTGRIIYRSTYDNGDEVDIVVIPRSTYVARK